MPNRISRIHLLEDEDEKKQRKRADTAQRQKLKRVEKKMAKVVARSKFRNK
jgi:hypothetical protein